MEVKVFIPDELHAMAGDLTRFWSAMVHKLRKNAHKGKWEGKDLQQVFVLLTAEVRELEVAISEGSFTEVLLEGADVANFALIATSIALEDNPRAVPSTPTLINLFDIGDKGAKA